MIDYERTMQDTPVGFWSYYAWLFRIAWRRQRGRYFILRDAPLNVVISLVGVKGNDSIGELAREELALRMLRLRNKLDEAMTPAEQEST